MDRHRPNWNVGSQLGLDHRTRRSLSALGRFPRWVLPAIRLQGLAFPQARTSTSQHQVRRFLRYRRLDLVNSRLPVSGSSAANKFPDALRGAAVS